MDRHDVSELVTSENVAQLHNEDLKIQHEYNCRALTYWFDDIKKIAFCLVEAPNKDSITKMHNQAHGEVPNQIIEVDPLLVESFLGRIEDPENTNTNKLNIIVDPAQRTLMNIRFTTKSLKNYNRSLSNQSMLKGIQIIGEMLHDFEGRIVRYKAGNLLISFKTIGQAVIFALKAIKGLTEYVNDSRFDIKIGMASGLPVSNNKTFFEETIKLSNYLCFINKDKILVTNEIMSALLIDESKETIDFDKLYASSLPDEAFINQLFNFIEDELMNASLKVDKFSKSLGLSKTLMYKNMITITGMSPNNFMKEYRLNRALEEMNSTKKSIAEIAFELGFNSTSYFSKCFLKRFGLLPSAYMK